MEFNMKSSINYFEKGNELLAQKKYADAIQCYEKDLKNGSRNNRSKVIFNMGIAYNYLCKYKKAVKCYEEVLKDKNYSSPYKNPERARQCRLFLKELAAPSSGRTFLSWELFSPSY